MTHSSQPWDPRLHGFYLTIKHRPQSQLKRCQMKTIDSLNSETVRIQYMHTRSYMWWYQPPHTTTSIYANHTPSHPPPFPYTLQYTCPTTRPHTHLYTNTAHTSPHKPPHTYQPKSHTQLQWQPLKSMVTQSLSILKWVNTVQDMYDKIYCRTSGEHTPMANTLQVSTHSRLAHTPG
jgi:hypothetical protein